MPSTTPPRLITLVFLTGLAVLTLNMFLPSLPRMAQTFGVDYALVNLSIAGYLGVTACLQLIIGPLSDRFGRRPVLLVALVIFVLASVGCIASTNIWVFLGFRVFQGAIVSAWVISLAVIRDTAPEQEAASRIGYLTMAMAVAPMLGPMLGGALDELFGWRSNFIFLLGFGVFVLALCWADVGETNRSPSETFAQQFKTYPQLLRSAPFWGYALCMMFSLGAFYSFLAGAPYVAENTLSLPPATLGIYIGSITAGFMFGSFLSGRYAKRYALTAMVLAGRIVTCVGLIVGLLVLAAGYLHPFTLFGSTIFVGIGNGLTMPGANTGVMSVLPRLAGSAAGLSGALMVGGGAILSTITGSLVTEVNGAYGLLGMLLFCGAMGLLAALYLFVTERRAQHSQSA